ncbi:MAG: TetR/AcrR family transcriptional regulator [Puniceicoccales bacterium]
MKRNRQQTEKRIVDAAIALLAADGFTGFGVNAVSARAGVDKVLIYRYFTGLEGLLDFIGKTEVLFPSAAAMLDTDLEGFYQNFNRAQLGNPLSASLHNWERVADNPLTQAFRRQRTLFWNDAAGLLRPQNDSARCLLNLVSTMPLDSLPASGLRPLLEHSQFAPVAPTAKGNSPVERLPDNLL